MHIRMKRAGGACSSTADCVSGNVCSKWGWCQWTTIYGQDGPSQVHIYLLFFPYLTNIIARVPQPQEEVLLASVSQVLIVHPGFLIAVSWAFAMVAG